MSWGEIRYRLQASYQCLWHAARNDVPIICRIEWVIFAVKALYLPLGPTLPKFK